MQSGFGALFRSIAQLADGGYIAVGNPALVKVDSSGNSSWNSTGYDAYSVSASQDGGLVVAGGLGDLLSPNQEVWVAKFASESVVPLDETFPFSAAWVVIAVVVVAVVGTGLLITLKKISLRKHAQSQ